MATTAPQHDVKDLALAPAGLTRIEWADRQMPVLAGDPRAVRARAPAQGPAHVGVPARDHRDRQPRAHARRPAAPRCVLCASNPLSTQDDVAAALVSDTASRSSPSRARTTTPTTATSAPALDHQPAAHDGRRRRPGQRAPLEAHRAARTSIIGGTEETTTGVIRLRAMAKDGVLELPDRRRQRRRRPSTSSTTATAPARARSTASSAPPTCCWRARRSSSAATAGAAGAWRCGPAGMGAHVIVDRGRPDPRARSGDGRLPGDADGRGRRDRRHLHHRHRQHAT